MVPQEDHTGLLFTAFIQFYFLTNGSDLFSSLSIVFSGCLKQNHVTVIVGVVKRRRQIVNFISYGNRCWFGKSQWLHR